MTVTDGPSHMHQVYISNNQNVKQNERNYLKYRSSCSMLQIFHIYIYKYIFQNNIVILFIIILSSSLTLPFCVSLSSLHLRLRVMKEHHALSSLQNSYTTNLISDPNNTARHYYEFITKLVSVQRRRHAQVFKYPPSWRTVKPARQSECALCKWGKHWTRVLSN